MGKRELLLIVAFVVLGAVVYQITAAPPPPGSEGASLSVIWRNIQRHIRGNSATATVDSTQSISADGIHALRVVIQRNSSITLTGADRTDISAQLHVTGRGFDDAEARAVAAATHVQVDRVGDAIVLHLDVTMQPRMTPLSQIALTVNLPRRLAVRVEPHVGPLTVADVASLNVVGERGMARVSSIGGEAAITHTGGELALDGCGVLTATFRGTRATLQHLGAPATIEAVGGSIDIDGLQYDTHIDSRNTRVGIVMAASAPVTIQSTTGAVQITPPASGYTLDAVATHGRVTIEDGKLQPEQSEDKERANGPVRGGGPTIAVRTTRADILVRAHSGR